MEIVVFIALVVVLLLLGMFIIPRWLLKRAISKVIRVFRVRNASGVENARTLEELGLGPKNVMQVMFRGRDYRQYALDVLIRAEIIRVTEDGRLYLSEEKLLTSRLIKST
jgi:hypothetical protein